MYRNTNLGINICTQLHKILDQWQEATDGRYVQTRVSCNSKKKNKIFFINTDSSNVKAD